MDRRSVNSWSRRGPTASIDASQRCGHRTHGPSGLPDVISTAGNAALRTSDRRRRCEAGGGCECGCCSACGGHHARNRTPPTCTSRPAPAQRSGTAMRLTAIRVALGIEARACRISIPLHRRVRNVALRAVPHCVRLIAEDVPRIRSRCGSRRCPRRPPACRQRAAQLDERLERGNRQRDAARRELIEHVGEVAPHPVRQQEPVVQPRAPADERTNTRLGGERGDERTREHALRGGHPRMRQASRTRAAQRCPGGTYGACGS